MRREALYNFIGLKEGEEYTIGLFIGFSFFMGVAVAIFYTATTSLFLIAFERTMLPKAFIIGGVTVYALGIATNYLQKKIRFTVLIKSLIYFLMASVTVLLLLFEYSDAKVFIFFLFVWNRVFVFVNGITFWSTAAKIFNIQQAKRLFGLIGAGEVISSILSFFSVPLLLKFISTDQLLYIVAFSVVGCIVLMGLIIRQFSSNLDKEIVIEEATPDASEIKTWKHFLANPYYRLVFLLAMMPVVGLFFVDFMFAIESKKVYPDKELLASFLGVFFGFCAIFEALIKTILYGKIMSNYGLKVGIAILPVALVFSVSLAVGYGVVYGTTALFFAFIVLSRFFMSPVRKSVNEPAFQMLLQPIPIQERAAVQSRIEGGPKALGNIVPGIILLVFTNYSFIGTVHIAAFFILILIGWFYLSLKTEHSYRFVLNSLLEKSQDWVNHSYDIYSNISRQIASIKKTPKLNYEYSNFDFIIKLSNSPEAHNRLLAAELLGESGRYFAFRYLGRLINDESPDVKQAAIKAAGVLRKTELWPLLISHLGSDQYHQSAAYALMSVGEPVVRELVRSFNRLEGPAEYKLRLIRVIRHIGGKDAINFFRSMMNTSDVLIRDEVYASLKQLRYSARITERGYLAAEIDSRIELLVWIMSSQRDLEEYPPWSQIQISLEKEKRRIIPKIFNLLSLLNQEQHYDFICDLLLREEQETYGYLLEVLNMTLPQEWKNKVIPLFEDRPIQERLRLCAEYYPSTHLSPEERLKDIINKHYSRTSQWLKVSALKELSQISRNNPLIFGALAVSPYEIIAEMALYELHRLDPSRFSELLTSMEDNEDAFHIRLCKKILAAPTEHDFLVHKVWVLSQTDLFSVYYEDELIDLAGSLDTYQLPAGHSLDTSVRSRYEKSLLIVSHGTISVLDRTDGSTKLLNSFDTIELSHIMSSKVSIQATVDTEIFYLDDQKIEGLRLIHESLDIPSDTKTQKVS